MPLSRCAGCGDEVINGLWAGTFERPGIKKLLCQRCGKGWRDAGDERIDTAALFDSYSHPDGLVLRSKSR